MGGVPPERLGLSESGAAINEQMAKVGASGPAEVAGNCRNPNLLRVPISAATRLRPSYCACVSDGVALKLASLCCA
jgi:hypothetical protein